MAIPNGPMSARIDSAGQSGWKFGACPPGSSRQSPTSAATAPILVSVRMFWMTAPSRSPKQLTIVSRRIEPAATSFTASGESGRKNPRYEANPTATNAREAGLMTTAAPQPYKYPHTGPKARRRETYWPPALGIAAPSPARQSAPEPETRAPTIQTSIVGKVAVKRAAIVLGTMKMDEPTIVPVLIMVASSRPSPGRSPSGATAGTAAGGAAITGWGTLVTDFLFAAEGGGRRASQAITAPPD